MPSVKGMDLTIDASFLPHDDPDASLAFYRDIVEMMAKGTYARVLLATADLDGTFARLEAAGAEIVQEPTRQSHGVRDFAVRDPAGNLIRVHEV